MITPEKAREIRELLSKGELSQRQIARKTGACRDTVAGIASGRRPADDDPAIRPVEPPERCPGCGNTVYMPCRQCLAESSKIAPRHRFDRQHPQDLQEPPTLDVNLKGKQRARYEAVDATITLPDDEHHDEHPPASLGVAACGFALGTDYLVLST